MQEIGRTARSVVPTAKRILTQSWGQILSLRLLVLLQGVIFQNSPAWNIHPLMCENVVVDGCTVFAGHGGFVVGSEMSGGVKNILVNNCQFLGTDVGLRFKSTRGRGGIVENIYIRDISMTDIKTDAITFNMYYGGKSVAEMLADGDNPDNTTKVPVTEETPIFRNIDIQDIVCNGAGRAMEFNGLPEMPIKGINLKNIVITAKKDATFTNCEDITKENINIKVQE